MINLRIRNLTDKKLKVTLCSATKKEVPDIGSSILGSGQSFETTFPADSIDIEEA